MISTLTDPSSPRGGAGYRRHDLLPRRLLHVEGGLPLAEPQHHDPIRDLEDVLEVVADHQHAEPTLAEALDQVDHLRRLRDAQRRRGLIEENDLRLPEQRAGDRHRLALPARQASHLGADAAERGHGELVEKLTCVLLHLGLVERRERDATVARHLLPEVEVRDYVEVVAKGKVLEDGRDPELAGRIGIGDLHRLALEVGLPGVGRLDAVDRLHQRGLACPVVAHQGDDLAGVDLEVDVGEGLNGAEALAEPPQREEMIGLAVAALLLLTHLLISSRVGFILLLSAPS